MKNTLTLFKFALLFLFTPGILMAQKTTSQVLRKLGRNPLKIVDSVKLADSVFFKTNPNDVATLTVMYDTTAMKLYGDEAKDGAIIVETKRLARKHYTTFLRRKSTQYDSLYNITKNDSTFQYIVNDKVTQNNYEGDLSLITDDSFISLQVITADEVKNKYNITGMGYGIVIYYKRRENVKVKN